MQVWEAVAAVEEVVMRKAAAVEEVREAEAVEEMEIGGGGAGQGAGSREQGAERTVQGSWAVEADWGGEGVRGR